MFANKLYLNNTDFTFLNEMCEINIVNIYTWYKFAYKNKIKLLTLTD